MPLSERSTGPKALAEGECKPIVLQWLGAALAALGRDDELLRAALDVNFAFGQLAEAQHSAHRERIGAVLRGVRGVVLDSRRRFAAVTEEAARALFRTHDIPPAYAVYGDRVYFTPRFAPYDAASERGFGPLCRATMVLHEAVHLVDPRSGDHEVHVSQWDEPRFSSVAPEHQLSNPSAYASFAGQIFERALTWPPSARFGAGNPER